MNLIHFRRWSLAVAVALGGTLAMDGVLTLNAFLFYLVGIPLLLYIYDRLVAARRNRCSRGHGSKNSGSWPTSGPKANDYGKATMQTNNNVAEDVSREADLTRLLPCPFCGGGTTRFSENGRVWAGTKYGDPVSVSVQHWCDDLPGPSRMIERMGRDKEQAIERWNMRSSKERKGRHHD